VRGADSESRSKLTECGEFDESIKSVLQDEVVAGARGAQLDSRRSNGGEVQI
jgi:hypothetical protein